MNYTVLKIAISYDECLNYHIPLNTHGNNVYSLLGYFVLATFQFRNGKPSILYSFKIMRVKV